MKKKILIIILSILCIVGIGFSTYFGISYFNKRDEYRQLIKDYNELVAMYNALTYDIEDAEEEISTLESDVSSLTDDYTALSDEYDTLLGTHNELVSDYNELVEKYNEETSVQYETPANLEDYATDISYEDISRNPSEYEGKAISMDGEVVQLLETENEIDIRLAVDGDYEEMVYIAYDPKIIEERVLEGDDITFYGIYYGITQYESTLGTTISIPLFWVDYIEID